MAAAPPAAHAAAAAVQVGRVDLAIVSAGAARQQWSPGLVRAHVLVNLEDHSNAFDAHSHREAFARAEGLGEWKHVDGLGAAFQAAMMQDEPFMLLQNEVRDTLLALAAEAAETADPTFATLVVVVWCAHGKHRSVSFAELLTSWAREQMHHFQEVEVVHCERPRWDRHHRLRWNYCQDTSLPLEWILGTHCKLDLTQSVPRPFFLRVDRQGNPRRWRSVERALGEGFFRSPLKPQEGGGVRPPAVLRARAAPPAAPQPAAQPPWGRG